MLAKHEESRMVGGGGEGKRFIDSTALFKVGLNCLIISALFPLAHELLMQQLAFRLLVCVSMAVWEKPPLPTHGAVFPGQLCGTLAQILVLACCTEPSPALNHRPTAAYQSFPNETADDFRDPSFFVYFMFSAWCSLVW